MKVRTSFLFLVAAAAAVLATGSYAQDRPPQGNEGIAAKYPGAVGMEKDPAVLELDPALDVLAAFDPSAAEESLIAHSTRSPLGDWPRWSGRVGSTRSDGRRFGLGERSDSRRPSSRDSGGAA